MQLKKMMLGCLATMAVSLMAVPAVFAGDGDDVEFTIDCNGFASRASTMTLNRDNTGTGREAFVVRAVDGNGKVIFNPVRDQFFVGGAVSWEQGEYFWWTAAPERNPIRIEIISQAGNGLSEQLVYSATGTCANLTGVNFLITLQHSVAGFFNLSMPADGRVSSVYPLNSNPPRPVNDEDLINSLGGHLVVGAEHLNLRGGPGIEYRQVGIVDWGTQLIALGINDASLAIGDPGLWWYVQVGGMRGWVKDELVVVRGNVGVLPEVPALGEPQVARLAVGYEVNSVYTSAGGTQLLCTVPGGLEYAIVGQNGDGSMFQVVVTCNGQSVLGWIPANRGIFRNPGEVVIPVTG